MDAGLGSLIRKLFFAVVACALLYMVYESKLVPRVYADEAGLGSLPRIEGSDPISPVQTAREVGRTFKVGDFTLRALAAYDIHGVNIRKAHSRYDDISGVSWVDMGIAFGVFLQKPGLLKHYRFFENERFLWARPAKGHEADFEAHLTHFSNNHLIFATRAIEKRVETVEEGKRIRLRGYLVAIEGRTMVVPSSLRRDDTGPGACEVLFVTDVKTYD